MTAEALRYLLLGTHYRSPIDFSDEALRGARAALDGFYNLLDRLREPQGKSERGEGNRIARAVLDRFDEQFSTAMDDDLNTAQALGVFHHARAEFNRALGMGLSAGTAREAEDTLIHHGRILGLDFHAPPHVTVALTGVEGTGAVGTITPRDTVEKGTISDAEVARLVDARNAARARKAWAEADAIRTQLADAGVVIEDRPDGTTRVKR
jgi:cysteinyl-tRNA synthetase